MFRAFYSLSKTPFTKEIDTNSAFLSTPFKELSARLSYVSRARGIALVTGEPGSGKTFALRHFADSLSSSLYRVVYIPLATITDSDFYRGLAFGLGETPVSRKISLFHQIQQAITDLYKERKITPVIILDEMHMARDAVFCDLSLLFNFDMDSANPFLLILSGLPHIQNRLNLNQHKPLTQRITSRYKLDPLTLEETGEYVAHHMKLAGANHEIFNQNAVMAIHNLTSGWMRPINQLATAALLAGVAQKADIISEEIIRLAAEEIYI